MNILEDNRNKLISRSKSAEREKDGKTRYQKRLKSKVVNSNKQYNQLDMNKLFKQGILDVTIHIIGETDNYDVKIKFGGILDSIHSLLRNNEIIDLRIITRAIIIAFNKEDVYISCSCPDFFYRFGYYATVNKINSGEPQLIPSKETNPNDNLGPGCKHSLIVLANTTWIIKVASVIVNYVKYMERYKENLYSKIIYPAIYEKEYTEPVQQSIFDDEEEIEDSEIDKANTYARTKSQFKPDNEYRFRKQDKDLENQIELEVEDEE